jgi:hypothetical protein
MMHRNCKLIAFCGEQRHKEPIEQYHLRNKNTSKHPTHSTNYPNIQQRGKEKEHHLDEHH